MLQQEIFNLISRLTGNANLIVIPKEIVKITGGYEAGALLSQLIYWTDKTKDGWIYKTYKEWEDELGLSEYQLRKAKTKLEKLELIETKLKKANGVPTIYYKVKVENLINLLIPNLSEINSNLKNFKNGILKNSRMDSLNFADSITETTNNNLYNIAENSAGVEEKLREKNKKSDSLRNKNETFTCKVTAGGEKTQTVFADEDKPKTKKNKAKREEDPKLKELKKALANMYAYLYKKTTKMKYPSEEYGKLMKLSEKAAKWLLSQMREGIIPDEKNLIYRVWVLLNFSFLRKKTDPTAIYGKIAETYAEMKSYQQEKRPFYKQIFEDAKNKANEDVEEIFKITRNFINDDNKSA